MSDEERRNEWIHDCLTSVRFDHMRGVKLFLLPYKAKSTKWDHDHCEFCWQKFTEDRPDTAHEGFTTEDRYYWVCRECFELFKDEYRWKTVETDIIMK